MIKVMIKRRTKTRAKVVTPSLPKEIRDLIIHEKPGVRKKSVAQIIRELRYGR